MIDLWPSLAAARLVRYFADQGKWLAAICHGPVVLASAALLSGEPWPFVGMNMTVFSTPAEKINEKRWNATLGFYPEDVLRNLGGVVVQAPMYAPHVVVSGKLITAQNPQSADLLAATLIKELNL
jgi:putative intracellular protease/amidase